MSNKPRKYHSLLERIDGKWCIQFGDYDRAVVVQEKQDTLESYDGPKSRRAKDLKIITTGDKQWQIDLAVHQLNYIPTYQLYPAMDPDAWMYRLAWLIDEEVRFQQARFEKQLPDTEEARTRWYVQAQGQRMFHEAS